MRAKWSAPIRKYWKISEQMMVKYCDLAICDSVNIEKYIHECYDGKAAQNDEAVQTAVKNVAEALGDTGRILVRESGTESVVRVMVEASDHDTCQKYVSEVVDVIRDRGYSL